MIEGIALFRRRCPGARANGARRGFRRGLRMGRDRWVADDYAERLARDMQLGKPLAVAWDPGNGAAGAVQQAL